jgi:hypothetical protein
LKERELTWTLRSGDEGLQKVVHYDRSKKGFTVPKPKNKGVYWVSKGTYSDPVFSLFST